MTYLVSYDLNAPGKDYTQLYNVLQSSDSWWHYLDSTWILISGKSLQSWTDRIRNAIDANDNFIIVDITGKQQNGWLPRKAWKWLEDNES